MSPDESPPLLSELRGRFRLVGVLWVTAMLAFAAGAFSTMGTLVGAVLSCVALVGAAVLLRCPSCGEGLFLHAISKQPVGQWLNWLLAVRECPTCGYTVGKAQAGTSKPSDPSQ